MQSACAVVTFEGRAPCRVVHFKGIAPFKVLLQPPLVLLKLLSKLFLCDTVRNHGNTHTHARAHAQAHSPWNKMQGTH